MQPAIAGLIDQFIDLEAAGSGDVFEFRDSDEQDEAPQANRTNLIYLFHTARCRTRCIDSSTWSKKIKTLFQEHCGKAAPPSHLRAAFITTLRSKCQDPELLRSASIAMRHRPETQAPSTYDLEANNKFTRAAFDFAASYGNILHTRT